MNPIIESNKEFAERLLEKLAPRVTDGTGISGTLNAGDTGALYHIAQAYLISLQCQWIDYETQVPQQDGRYQIFVSGEQLTADYSVPFGFTSVEDGCAFIQELITHWMPLPQPPKEQP